jgi:hypothetical protein
MTRSLRILILLFSLLLMASIRTPSASAPLSQGFATYLGLADCDGIAEWHGDIFLACHSARNQLPDQVAELGHWESKGDAYVVRLSPTTGNLVYATRLGGSGTSAAFRIKVDRKGFAYATGYTRARDFPTTPDAVQRSFGGGQSDAFVVKLAPDGRVVYSTFLGGTGDEESYGLDVDDRGGVFVGGTTWSADFPGQRTARAAVHGDAFVSHLRTGDATSLRSVLFGGSQEEKLAGIALDGRGGLFAVGHTKSEDFPLVQPLQAELKGAQNVFLVRLSAHSLLPTFATYFGGSGEDYGWGVAVDRQGDPVVAGTTSSGDLPVAADTFQSVSKGGSDAFVARFQGAGYHEIRVTYFGGSKEDSSGFDGDDVKVDSAGNVWLVGFTASPDLPGTGGFPPQPGREENRGFVAAFSPSLAQLCFATYDGGSEGEQLEGLALSSNGLVLATGFSFSTEIPALAVVDQKKKASRLNGREVHTRILAVPISVSCR